MKKVFILIISIMLAISISACGGNKTDSPDISTVDSNNYMELPDEDPEEDIVDTKATKISDSIADKFKEFSDAETEFDHHVYEISHKVETVSLHQNAVMITDMKVLDHMLPLYLWGETHWMILN